MSPTLYPHWYDQPAEDVRAEQHFEARRLELGAQRLARVATHVAERLVGSAPEPWVAGNDDDHATVRPKQPTSFAQHRNGVGQALEHVERAHHVRDPIDEWYLVQLAAHHLERVAAVGLVGELLGRIRDDRSIGLPAELCGDVARATTQIDQSPFGLSALFERKIDEGGLRPKPPVSAIGARDHCGARVDGVTVRLRRPGHRRGDVFRRLEISGVGILGKLHR